MLTLFAMTSLQARIRISSTVKAIIEERRRSNINGCKKSDFLEILLCVESLSQDEKVSFVLDSLLGGYETTSLLMSMVVFFLDRSPEAVHQLKVNSSFEFQSRILFHILLDDRRCRARALVQYHTRLCFILYEVNTLFILVFEDKIMRF